MKIALLALVAVGVSAQPLSGILDQSRWIDWSVSGAVGFTIPNFTTNCTTQPSLTANSTSSASTNTSQINAAIASCDGLSTNGHNVVNIPAGTFYYNTIDWAGKSNVVLKGAGPNSTTLVNLNGQNCGGYTQVKICMAGGTVYAQSSAVAQGAGNTSCLFTATNGVAGTYTQGATSITLNSCGVPPVNGQLMFLDQQDDGLDNGGIWVCTGYDLAVAVPCNQNGISDAWGRILNNTTSAWCSGASSSCNQRSSQQVLVTNCTGSGAGPYTCTIPAPGLYFNNFRSSQNPGAWWIPNETVMTHSGIENLTLDWDDNAATVNVSGKTVTYVSGSTFSGAMAPDSQHASNNGYIFINGTKYDISSVGSGTLTLVESAGTLTGATARWNDEANGGFGWLVEDCIECWASNIRSINGNEGHIQLYSDLRPMIRDSYFFGNMHGGSESYCIQVAESSGVLVENNIIQNTTSPDIKDQVTGSATAYNFTPFVNFSNTGSYMQGVYVSHNGGSAFNLFEGNITTEFLSDDVWGVSDLIMLFRNQAYGWQPGFGPSLNCGNGTCQTNTVLINTGVRGVSVIGNVLGTPGYHNQYQTWASGANATSFQTTEGGSTGSGIGNLATSIYELGTTDTGQNGNCTQPPICDTIVKSTIWRWGNWDPVDNAVQWNASETALSSVPYLNATTTPSSHTLPTSLIHSSKPSWFGSAPWPTIGPDVSGNVGQCTSGTYSGVGALSSGQCAGGSFTASSYGGFVGANPAMICYLNTMGGAPDGSGGPYAFDANTCYSSSGPPPTNPARVLITWGIQ